jgi:glycopeptide antibiotics resistance protein
MLVLMQKRLLSLILVAYSALLIKVVVFKDLEVRTRFMIFKLGPARPGPANFVPFKTILPQLRGEPHRFVALMNLLGNTAPFVPIGFLVPLIYPKMTWRKSLALAVAVGFAMEGMEGLFRVGIVDVDDVILNAFGVMIGYGLFTIFRNAKGKGNVSPSATTTTTR